MIILSELDTRDWKEAFAYAKEFKLVDVATIINKIEGENDGDDWIIYGTLRDGRFFSLKAGCDYTGWDCRASGVSHVASQLEELIRFGMDAGTRKRFDVMLEGEK